jgi:hypothetical protein
VLSHAPENVTARFTLRRALLKLHLPQQAADEFVQRWRRASRPTTLQKLLREKSSR